MGHPLTHTSMLDVAKALKRNLSATGTELYYNNITHFILIGFPTSPGLQYVLFTVFLIIYFLTVIENVTIIVTITVNSKLHKPMYYLLCSLSLLENLYITVTAPTLHNSLLIGINKIPYAACMAQLYIFISLACTESALLAVMAFDRYVAICLPLRYMVIMNNYVCFQLAIGSWVTGFSISAVKTIYICRLHFCGSNIINHFFCDISPLLNLACGDITFLELLDFILAMIIIIIPLVVVIFSYICIIRAVLIMSNKQGRQKAFSTCASHLIVVIIFYTTTLFIYARPRKAGPLDRNKLVTILYAVLTPFLNPVIYCLRNREVQQALKKLLTPSSG
ncbi:olfactory receptor 6B1-like [Eleutherodactylus coqui]|uniref:olfactory receptor 6B1-like n=1 Tax=Eleutherodactylus coqui TaxID=57060 RepID=UPI003461DE48